MKYFLMFAISLMAYGAMAQKQIPADSIPFEVRKQAYIYTLAKKYNDPVVARMALYNLIATNPNSTTILDSLALWYFDDQQFVSSALVAQDASRMDPSDLFATEVAAVSFENLGVKDRAVIYYEKLYLANNDLSTLYKLSFLQLELKRYGEAINNADALIENPKSATMKLLFPINQNDTQEISMKAASIRLKGMIELDRGNKALAKEFYQKALALEPNFVILKQQIAELDKK